MRLEGVLLFIRKKMMFLVFLLVVVRCSVYVVLIDKNVGDIIFFLINDDVFFGFVVINDIYNLIWINIVDFEMVKIQVIVLDGKVQFLWMFKIEYCKCQVSRFNDLFYYYN